MAHEKLFIEWLQKDLTHFVALVEEGSAAAGDPWQPGFSDHDLTVVVRQDFNSEMNAVGNFLSEHPLGDTCLVNVELAEIFKSVDTIQDLSLKFRAKVIAGEDVVTQKAPPNRKKATILAKEGLERLTPRLERRWVNLPSWSIENARHKNYTILKSFFVYSAAYYYGKTGHYPSTRAEVASLMQNQELANQLLEVTNGIATASKHAQKAAIEAALKLTLDIIGQP